MVKYGFCLLIAFGCWGGEFLQAADGGCDTCYQEGCTSWTCIPRATQGSVEVTEWGVVLEPICRPKFRLFCLHSDCDSCDGLACDDACDAHGLHDRSSTPCFSHRLRKRLMRKTLVYSVPTVEYVATPQYSIGCDSGQGPCCDDAACDDLGCQPLQGATLVGGLGDTENSSTYWMPSFEPSDNVQLATSHQNLPPIVSADADVNAASTANIRWIPTSDPELVEQLTRIFQASGTQPPAPMAITPMWATPDVLSETPSRETERR